MPRLWFAIALYSASLFFPCQYAAMRLHAEPGLPDLTPLDHTFSANRILDFAAQLMLQKEYYRAITEYRRFLFRFPNDKRGSMAHFRIGLALYRGRSYGEALTAFGKIAEAYPELPHGKLARLWMGECLMMQGKFEAAENLYSAAILRLAGEQLGDHADYRHAWALLNKHEWQEARMRFQNLPGTHSFHESAQHIADAIPDIEHYPRKSPLLAGVLSAALPGSGQLYIGRRGDAWLAFLLNSLFVVGIVEALNHDRPAVAGMLGLFEAGWYAGNIYGAVNGAHKYNAHQAARFIQEMKNQFPYAPPNYSPTAAFNGIRLGLRY